MAWRKMNLFGSTKDNRMRSGQSLVEFSLILLLLLMLVAGVVDLGRLAFTVIDLRDAAQEGLSYAIIDPTNCAEIEARAMAVRENTGLSPINSVEIKIDGSKCNLAPANQACAGHEVKVVTHLDQFIYISPIADLIAGFVNQPISATAVGSILTPVCH